jgi:hypothetical protein
MLHTVWAVFGIEPRNQLSASSSERIQEMFIKMKSDRPNFVSSSEISLYQYVCLRYLQLVNNPD